MSERRKQDNAQLGAIAGSTVGFGLGPRMAYEATRGTESILQKLYGKGNSPLYKWVMQNPKKNFAKLLGGMMVTGTIGGALGGGYLGSELGEKLTGIGD